ncbi:hypothetical protein [Actinomadura hibisca]|uniref:hypothetical protein n=1 Tax=Actinomadura hibisca TaxID=68565 RepID=UPI00082D00DC|nr:hypothetical protein [Actinomadura hibisca]
MASSVVNGVLLEGSAEGITIVKGAFGRKKRKCLKGFGICKIKVFPPSIEEDMDALERRIAEPHEEFYAAFLLKEERSALEIRFLEPLPQYEADFYVDEGYPGVERMLRDVCGYAEILPTIGDYQARQQPDAPHGVVTLDVQLGPRQSQE